MDQLTLLPEDSLANLTASPGNAEATMMTVRSGRKCSESYERQGPLGSLVRMCLESSAWRSTACLLIWSVKATPARRSLFQLAPWMQSTDETESGLWQTPVADDAVEKAAGKWNSRGEPKLSAQAAMWPTVRASDGERGGRGDLIQAVRGNENKHFKMWPTPKVASGDYSYQPGTKTKVLNLMGAVKLYPSPTASTGGPEPEGKTGRKLATVVGGSLNPTWVEWLMGYPLGWTDLKDSETPSSPKSPPRSSRKSSKSTTAP